MSLRLEMLQVTRLAPQLLRESSDLVRDFVLSLQRPDGGFAGRDGHSDLYYSVFGVECLRALDAELPIDTFHGYLSASFTVPAGATAALDRLDLVHLASLVRASASSDYPLVAERGEAIERALQRFRTADGGYHNSPGESSGTIYGSFLAIGALQDLGADDIDTGRVARFLATLRTPGGGYANDCRMDDGSTAATAAAVALSRNLDLDGAQHAAEWLLEHCWRAGGFCASARTPAPDLLSTATALHALAGLGASLNDIRTPCLDFIDTLWSSRGGFYGHWADDVLDCEYTFYGLLALGHLTV